MDDRAVMARRIVRDRPAAMRVGRRAVRVPGFQSLTIQTPAPGAARPAQPMGSQRAQLLAAAASLVWFAGWFQGIYEEIVGRVGDDE